jgi:hypothetical protein
VIRDDRTPEQIQATPEEMLSHAQFVAARVKEHKMPEQTAIDNIRWEFRITSEEAKKLYEQAA